MHIQQPPKLIVAHMPNVPRLTMSALPVVFTPTYITGGPMQFLQPTFAMSLPVIPFRRAERVHPHATNPMTPSTPQLNTSATPEPVTAKTSQAQSSPTTTPTGTSKPYSQQQPIRRLRCRRWQLRPDLRPGTRCLDRDQLRLRSTRTSLRVGRLASRVALMQH